MKTLKIYLTIAFFSFCSALEAQILKNLGKKAQKATERTIERRVEREASKKTDKAIDKILEPGKDSSKDNRSDVGKVVENTQKPEGQNDMEVFRKFDFIPGEKIIAVEDFSQDAIGDFPAKWASNSSGEIVTFGNSETKWLAITASGALMPEFINFLPENFTLEFELAVSPSYSFYDHPLFINMVNLKLPENFTAWTELGAGKHTGVTISLHPQDATLKQTSGMTAFVVWQNGIKTMNNNNPKLGAFNTGDNSMVKVSIWRQKQRLRVYVDEAKIWDLPRVFDSGTKYNGLIFSRYTAKAGNNFYISNIRFAVGEPDTRNKLINKGNFSTTGIHFNTGLAVIKPESYAVLKDIATVLNENPNVSVNIVGHTDSDGSANLNLKLSIERAESVKLMLSKEFGIAANRMQTDGKGASNPVGDNKSAEGKAANRRVEFIRL